MDTREHTVVIGALTAEEGAGNLTTVPHLTGCMSDGETRAEAAVNVEDAIGCRLESWVEMGREIPAAKAIFLKV